MTLAQIMTLALRQLDEDPADIDEYAELFRRYANEGLDLAASQYYKPRDTMTLHTDENGRAYLCGIDAVRIIAATDENGRPVWYEISMDGESLTTPLRDADVTLSYERRVRMLKNADDEPELPEHAHASLADYICYRHLSGGNLAKQSRAQHYLQMFHQGMSRIRPQGDGSVRRMRNLYAATDIRSR